MSTNDRLAVVTACVTVLLGACTPTKRATLDQLRVRSAFDLGCPQQMITLHYVDQRTRGVVGCGRRLAYLESCDQSGRCTWQLDQRPEGVRAAAQVTPVAPLPAAAAAIMGTPSPARMGLLCQVVPLAGTPTEAGSAKPAAPPADGAPDTRHGGGEPAPGAQPTTPYDQLDPFEDRH